MVRIIAWPYAGARRLVSFMFGGIPTELLLAKIIIKDTLTNPFTNFTKNLVSIFQRGIL